MQFLALLAAPLFLAGLAAAQDASSTTSAPYDNPFTSFLTQTDSNGVITGMPTLATNQPDAATTQAPAASIPAGLASGLYTIPYGNETSFVVSVGDGTTAIVTPPASSAEPTGGADATTGGEEAATGTDAAQSSSTGAANVVRVAGGALVGAGAFVVALL